MSTITIPAELVPLVRDGCYSDLPADVCGGLDERAWRACGARALLDAIGWQDSVDEPDTEVDVDACQHREALLRALLWVVAVAHGIEGDRRAGIGRRAEARVHVAEFAGLVQRIEERGE